MKGFYGDIIAHRLIFGGAYFRSDGKIKNELAYYLGRGLIYRVLRYMYSILKLWDKIWNVACVVETPNGSYKISIYFVAKEA